MPLADGEVFAGFRILRPLGFGGMGEVYLVQHPRLPRQDALKILPAEMSADPEFRARFNREAEMAAALYHPHIVGIHDRGEFNGQLWISMDFIDGPDAGRLLRDQYPNGMPPPEVVDIVAAVADALDYAHSRGLLHRDVKPPNILLTNPERGRRLIVLADFGIARDAGDSNGLTATNVTVGTVNYASPEQLMGAPIDGRADQYALAATAYHLFSGSPMFGSSNAAVVIGQHLNAAPPRLGDSRPALARLDPVLGRALSKNPADRFRSCAEFADALRQAVSPPVAMPPGPPPVQQQMSRPPLPPAAPPAPAAPPSRQTAYLPSGYAAEPAGYSAYPAEPAGYSEEPPVGYSAASNADEESGETTQARWPWILAAVALVAILGALLFAVWPRHDEPATTAGPSTSTSRTSTSRPIATTTTTTTSAAPATVTFDSMRDLVNGFYGQLPNNARGAWNMLDVYYQQRNGLGDYLGFWSTIQSVSVLAISPRDANSVVATIRYVLNDGRVDTENRWLSVVPVNGQLLIYDSERIGPA
jgi:serine/threonine-protein kinase